MAPDPEEPQADTPAPGGCAPGRRPMCPRCRRPVSVCYCEALTRLETRSRVVILQHPREAGMPIGTAHMAHLCLPSSRLHVGIEWQGSEALREACGDPQRPAVLLYPGAEARDILTDPPETPVTLIVVDGTWAQARKVVRLNPALAALPRYAFDAPAPSNYRIRREPSEAYVSTLEALVHVLGALEGDPERFEALRRPMDAMVDAQLRAQARARAQGEEERHPRVRSRPSPYARLPVEIRERPDDLVVVMGEANAWPHRTAERALGDELVYWVALRPATGAVYAEVIAPRLPLAPEIPLHAGLEAARLHAGESRSAFLAAWKAFSTPDDVLCSWGHHSLRILRAAGAPAPPAFLDLRRPARALHRGKVGRLEPYCEETGLVHAPVASGRAGARVGMLSALLGRWQAMRPPAG